jgi:hypothetical protein
MKIDSDAQVPEVYEYGFSASTAEQVDEILDVVNQNAEEELVPDLSDVELRFEEASCYKALLRNPLFESGAGPIARKVEQKIQNYIKQELKILLGIDVPKPVVQRESQFVDEEVKVLKMLVSKVLNKPPQPTEKRELVVNRAHVESPVIEPKLVQTVSPEVKPVLPRRGRPPAKPKDGIERKKEKLLIRGKLVEVEVPVKDPGQVRPTGARPLPTLTPDQAVMHTQSVVSTTGPKSGLLGLAVQHAIKNGTEDGE